MKLTGVEQKSNKIHSLSIISTENLSSTFEKKVLKYKYFESVLCRSYEKSMEQTSKLIFLRDKNQDESKTFVYSRDQIGFLKPLKTSSKTKIEKEVAWLVDPSHILHRIATPKDYQPKIVLIGRTNVGKSALLNRITRSQSAVVHNLAGLTRDRMYHTAEWNGRNFLVVDSGGIELNLIPKSPSFPNSLYKSEQSSKAKKHSTHTNTSILREVNRQTLLAVEEADLILMVVDKKSGPTRSDNEILNWIRRYHNEKPTILVVNKCDNNSNVAIEVAAFWELGLEPNPVSAINGSHLGELLDKVVELLPNPQILPEHVSYKPPLKVAIVGRPNVGKSSLLNALVGENRSVVSELAGTTIGAFETEILGPENQPLTIFDTAGVRKRSSIAASRDSSEELSVRCTLRAIHDADIVVLLLDVLDGVTVQDFRLSEKIAKEWKSCLIVVNKCDLLPKKKSTILIEKTKDVLKQLRPINWATVVFTSSKTKSGIHKLLKEIVASGVEYKRRISTATINMIISETNQLLSSNMVGNHKTTMKIYYATQFAVAPPTFVLFVNDPKNFDKSIKKTIEAEIRKQVAYRGTRLRLLWKKAITKRSRA